MAHPQQQEFFVELARRFEGQFQEADCVLEVGSQNINGTVRGFFSGASSYIGLDLGLAKDVDWVIPGELVELPEGWADICVTTECLEHCEAWQHVLLNMIRILRPGGLLIITCASLGRPAHGSIDSETESSPFTTSYYRNLGPDDIAEKVKINHYFDKHCFELDPVAGDLYFWGLRSTISFTSLESHWSSSSDRLARAQGQLAQAAHRHHQVSLHADRCQAEADLARAEAEKLRCEAEQSRAEKARALLDVEQMRQQVSEMQLHVEECLRQSDSHQKHQEELKKQCEHLRADNHDLRRQAEEYRLHIQHTRLEMGRAEMELCQAKIEIERVHAETQHWLAQFNEVNCQRKSISRFVSIQGRLFDRYLAVIGRLVPANTVRHWRLF
jgi:SAM-dependent methyltransferase